MNGFDLSYSVKSSMSRWQGGLAKHLAKHKRKHTSVVGLLSEKLKEGGRHVGVAAFISQAIKKTVEISVDEEVLELCSANPEFAKFLTQYLKGKPSWLKYL